MQNQGDALYRTLTKTIKFAAVTVVLLWLLYKASVAVLILLLAIILALVINTPVAALEQKGMKRGWACALVFSIILLVLILLGWLIVPKISEQLKELINNLPAYAEILASNIASWFSDYPQIDQEIRERGLNFSQWLPSVPQAFMKVGNYSLSFITMILIIILLISMVVYAVTNPRPLLQLYFSFFPADKQQKATDAIRHASVMLNGWIRSNIIGGIIRATCIIIFLSILDVPGAWVWGGVAFFAELIPKIGFYLMAVPPIIMAFAVSPMTAFWVTIFMLALDELMGDFILPKIRANTMNIHPVSVLFVLLAMVMAFGVLGAILATPVAAIIKAYYEGFYIKKKETTVEAQIDAVIYRSTK